MPVNLAVRPRTPGPDLSPGLCPLTGNTALLFSEEGVAAHAARPSTCARGAQGRSARTRPRRTRSHRSARRSHVLAREPGHARPGADSGLQVKPYGLHR